MNLGNELAARRGQQSDVLVGVFVPYMLGDSGWNKTVRCNFVA